MSLSSKLKKQQSQSNILSPDTATRTIRVLEEVKAKMSDPVELHDSQEEESELELPRLELPPLVEDSEKVEENYSNIVFIADYKLTADVAKTLDKFLCIRNFDENSFKNRNLEYLKDTNVNYIWANLHEKGCRNWVRKNINHASVYKFVATYDVKHQAWVADLSEYVDITVSKKNLRDCSYLTLGELLDEVRSKAIKIHPPISGCLDKLFFKNRLVQQSKN
jgi:hypothetical protein